MSKKIAEGDLVQIADREAVAADVKSQLFYEHYRGLVGTLAKLYPDGTALVNIDLDSLPAEIRTRHTSGTNAMRLKWLEGLSDEARNRLSATEKRFTLRYTILVAATDLTHFQGSIAEASPKPQTSKAMLAAKSPSLQPALLDLEENPDTPEPPRKSLAELEAEEERHLEEISQKRNNT